MMPRAAALALGIALSSSDDYALVARDPAGAVVERMCVTTLPICQQAIGLIRSPIPGVPPFAPELRGRHLSCDPTPGCFTPDEGCIKGFNCR